MNPLTGIYDDAGRYLAPAPVLYPVRPDGPWDTNTPVVVPLIVICAWCDDFDPTSPANAHASHGICAGCVARLDQAIAA